MILTSIQAMHYPTIKYYLDDARAQGKTDLLAYTYLVNALEHPGRDYYPIDFPNKDIKNNEMILRRIIQMAKNLNIQIEISKINLSFKAIFPNPYIPEEIVKRLPK